MAAAGATSAESPLRPPSHPSSPSPHPPPRLPTLLGPLLLPVRPAARTLQSTTSDAIFLTVGCGKGATLGLFPRSYPTFLSLLQECPTHRPARPRGPVSIHIFCRSIHALGFGDRRGAIVSPDGFNSRFLRGGVGSRSVPGGSQGFPGRLSERIPLSTETRAVACIERSPGIDTATRRWSSPRLLGWMDCHDAHGAGKCSPRRGPVTGKNRSARGGGLESRFGWVWALQKLLRYSRRTGCRMTDRCPCGRWTSRRLATVSFVRRRQGSQKRPAGGCDDKAVVCRESQWRKRPHADGPSGIFGVCPRWIKA